MSNLTKMQVQAVRKQLETVLANAGINNMEFSLGNARFGDTEVTFQLKGKVAGAKSRAETALEMYSKMDGIDPTKVLPNGERLVEYHVRKPKYPYISENKHGTKYKMSPAQAKARFSA